MQVPRRLVPLRLSCCLIVSAPCVLAERFVFFGPGSDAVDFKELPWADGIRIRVQSKDGRVRCPENAAPAGAGRCAVLVCTNMDIVTQERRSMPS